jgi:putative oxidoreductase
MFNRSRVLLWTCAIVLAVAFVAVGVSKLGGPSAIRWNGRFTGWGYPAGTATAVGVLEILGGVGVLFPRWRRPAAVVLVALMIGAVFTHVLNAELARVVPPLVLGAIALLVCFRPERSGRRLASPKAR